MSGHDKQDGVWAKTTMVFRKWTKYILLYSAFITLLLTFYANWDNIHTPARVLLGTHTKQPLNKRMLLQVAKDISDEYINVDTKTHFSHQCHDCAMIISSGQLLDKKAGKEIDNASCVIRMNDAPTVGYTVDVGSKTTLRVVCFKSLEFLKDSTLLGRGKTEMVAVWGVDNPHHSGHASYMMRRVMTAYGHTPVQFYSMKNKGEDKVVEVYQNELGIDRVKTNTWVSTGVFTMLLAIQMCDGITVYGLADENHCRLHPDSFIPYHYYGRSMLECEMYKQHQEEMTEGSHRFVSEKTMFRHWASMLDIKFRYPSWNLKQLNVDSGQR